MGINVTYPDINKSGSRFSIDNKEIIYGLNLIKGVGNAVIQKIIENRPYNSFEDLIEKNKLDKTTVISLIKSGALDFTGRDRRDLLYTYQKYRFTNKLDEIKPVTNINKTHIDKLIEAKYIRGNEAENKDLCLKLWNEWRFLQHKDVWESDVMAGNEFNWEYDSISYHLRGNPFENINIPLWETYEEDEGQAKVGGTIIFIKKNKIKKGKQIGKTMAFINLDTVEGIREITAFSDTWEKFQDKLEKGAMVVCRGKKQGEKLLLNGVKDIEGYKE